jgi:predicted DNA-binding protein (MmcQ/YjbR family)
MDAYAADLPEVTRTSPFGEDVPVYKVLDKMFMLMGERHEGGEINLKVDPEEAPLIREQFSAVTGGWHMNKRHWNTVVLDGSIEAGIIEDWILDSYDLVVAKMTKKDQAFLRTD